MKIKLKKFLNILSLLISLSSIPLMLSACVSTRELTDQEKITENLKAFPDTFTLKNNNSDQTKESATEFVNVIKNATQNNQIPFLLLRVNEGIPFTEAVEKGIIYNLQNFKINNQSVSFDFVLRLNKITKIKKYTINNFKILSKNEILNVKAFYASLKGINLKENANYFNSTGKLYSSQALKKDVHNLAKYNTLLQTKIHPPTGFSVELSNQNIAIDTTQENTVLLTFKLKKGKNYFNEEGKIDNNKIGKTIQIQNLIIDSESQIKLKAFNQYKNILVNKKIEDLKIENKELSAKQFADSLADNNLAKLQEAGKETPLFNYDQDLFNLELSSVSAQDKYVEIKLLLKTKEDNSDFQNKVINNSGTFEENYKGKTININGFLSENERLLNDYFKTVKSKMPYRLNTDDFELVKKANSLAKLNRLLTKTIPLKETASAFKIVTIRYQEKGKSKIEATIFVSLDDNEMSVKVELIKLST